MFSSASLIYLRINEFIHSQMNGSMCLGAHIHVSVWFLRCIPSYFEVGSLTSHISELVGPRDWPVSVSPWCSDYKHTHFLFFNVSSGIGLPSSSLMEPSPISSILSWNNFIFLCHFLSFPFPELYRQLSGICAPPPPIPLIFLFDSV